MASQGFDQFSGEGLGINIGYYVYRLLQKANLLPKSLLAITSPDHQIEAC